MTNHSKTDWVEVNSITPKDLITTRKSLHQAVQLVGAVPRKLLDHDPTDASASLDWNSDMNGLQSTPVSNVIVGLAFSTFSLYVLADEKTVSTYDLHGKTVEEGLAWLKEILNQQGLAGEKVDLSLPYEIEDYDYSNALEVNKVALNIFSTLYHNTQEVLEGVIDKWSDAYEIKCWPHHFDIATLIPVEVDEKGELQKSIGVGLSPGDEGVEEPYIYVNTWPSVDYQVLSKNSLNAGHWNKEGWSGAVLTYSELLKAEDQQEAFDQYIFNTISVLEKA